MKITDITPETENQYFCCLEDWSEEMKEAGDHKQKWYNQMKDKGLKVKFALDENDIIGGMIQYLPVEHSIFEGRNLYAVLCIWVHGHKQGRGNYRGRGMGKALLKAAEEDARQLGAEGIAAWGIILPAFMRASWFKKQGYKVADRSGIMRLLWKPFSEKAMPPEFIKAKKYPLKVDKKVNVSVFCTGWCQAMNMTFERARRASQEFIDKVNLQFYDTTDNEVLKEWGITDALFVDNKEIRTGPPPSYEKIRKKIEKKIQRLD